MRGTFYIIPRTVFLTSLQAKHAQGIRLLLHQAGAWSAALGSAALGLWPFSILLHLTVPQCFLVLACLYGIQFVTSIAAAVDCGPPPVAVGPLGGLASTDVDSTDVAAVKSFDTCMVKWNVLYLLYIPATLGFLIYAGYRRNQMRQRFNIAGDEALDYAGWLCCGPCALCQETRTLAYHSVEDGVWPGEAAPLVAAPGVQKVV